MLLRLAVKAAFGCSSPTNGREGKVRDSALLDLRPSLDEIGSRMAATSEANDENELETYLLLMYALEVL